MTSQEAQEPAYYALRRRLYEVIEANDPERLRSLLREIRQTVEHQVFLDVLNNFSGPIIPIVRARLNSSNECLEVLYEERLHNTDVLVSLLSDAIHACCPERVALALKYGADPNYKDFGIHPAIVALVSMIAANLRPDLLEGYYQCLDLMLNHPTIDLDMRGNSGFSPLGYAIQYPRVRLVKILLEHGADITQQIRYEWANECGLPLYFAKKEENKHKSQESAEIVRLIEMESLKRAFRTTHMYFRHHGFVNDLFPLIEGYLN